MSLPEPALLRMPFKPQPIGESLYDLQSEGATFSMRISPPEPEIGLTDGFEFAKDIFGRAAMGKGLLSLVGDVTEPMVLAVDGQWGSGKTVFLKMWAGELRKANHPVIYFDAFQNDYVTDAFAALAGELIEFAGNRRGSAKKLKSHALAAGKVIFRSGAKIAAHAGARLIIGEAVKEKLLDEIAKEATDSADKLIEKIILTRREQKETLDNFRNSLSELSSMSDTNSDEVVKPLIFIIDELDRCRPAFAIELLERIKHFFSVKNVHFVLGVNLSQLEIAIGSQYGIGTNARAYLEKFINVVFNLGDLGKRPNEWASTKYIEYLAKCMDFPAHHKETVSQSLDLFVHLAHYRQLSLRTIGRIFSTLSLGLAYVPGNYFKPPPILAGLSALKVLEPDLFNAARRGALSLGEATSALCLDKPALQHRDMEFEIMWWRYCLDENVEPELINKLSETRFRYNIGDRQELVPLLANSVIDKLKTQ